MFDVAAPNVRVVTPATDLSVSVEEMKRHLRVGHDEDDAQIESYTRAAEAYLDAPTGRLGIVLSERTLEMPLDGFPGGEIRLPVGPVQSVTSISYVDEAGAQQTVSADSYVVDASDEQSGWIIPAADYAWPEAMSMANAVRIQWVAGADCPEPIRHFIKLVVGRWYADREVGSIDDLPWVLVAPWRAYR